MVRYKRRCVREGGQDILQGHIVSSTLYPHPGSGLYRELHKYTNKVKKKEERGVLKDSEGHTNI